VKVELGPDWTEFLELLTSHRVRFMLVGGHAVASHGEPRFTEDLDVFVAISPANARRLREVLIDFGFGDEVPEVEAFMTEGKVWMVGRKPWRIDVLTSIDGVTFDEAWKGRSYAKFNTGRLPIIGLKELLKNKKAAGRPKDLADVAALEALAKPRTPRGLPKRKKKPKSDRGTPGASSGRRKTASKRAR
jgi:hypothetical protein